MALRCHSPLQKQQSGSHCRNGKYKNDHLLDFSTWNIPTKSSKIYFYLDMLCDWDWAQSEPTVQSVSCDVKWSIFALFLFFQCQEETEDIYENCLETNRSRQHRHCQPHHYKPRAFWYYVQSRNPEREGDCKKDGGAGGTWQMSTATTTKENLTYIMKTFNLCFLKTYTICNEEHNHCLKAASPNKVVMVNVLAVSYSNIFYWAEMTCRIRW